MTYVLSDARQRLPTLLQRLFERRVTRGPCGFPSGDYEAYRTGWFEEVS